MKKKDDIIRLLEEGLTYNEIARRLHCSKSTISFHASKISKPPQQKPDPQKTKAGIRYNWEEISVYIESGHGYKECAEKFGISPTAWNKAMKRGAIPYIGRSLPLDSILISGRFSNTSGLRRRMIEAGLLENKCSSCGITEWQNRPITLQLDHINGDNSDNRVENLRILCPNCHSQTATYGSKNRKTARMDTPGRKKCSRCKTAKPLSSFHKDHRSGTGVQRFCKECSAILHQEKRGRRSSLLDIMAAMNENNAD